MFYKLGLMVIVKTLWESWSLTVVDLLLSLHVSFGLESMAHTSNDVNGRRERLTGASYAFLSRRHFHGVIAR